MFTRRNFLQTIAHAVALSPLARLLKWDNPIIADWHFLAVVWDRFGIREYVDGKLVEPTPGEDSYERKLRELFGDSIVTYSPAGFMLNRSATQEEIRKAYEMTF